MIKDLSKYRKLAEEATPGPWVALEVADEPGNWWVWQESKLPYYGGVAEVVGRDPGSICYPEISGGHGDGEQERLDAEFISAFNPSVAIYLIDRIRIAEDQRDRVTADRDRCQDFNRNLVNQLSDARFEKSRSILSNDIYAHENSKLTSEIKTLRAKVEMLENTLSNVGFVVDNLHSTSTIDQDTADQLTDAIEGNNTP